VLIRGIRGQQKRHEFHEFHENDPCDLDAIGSKYKFSESHGRAIDMHLTVTPKNLTGTSDCTQFVYRKSSIKNDPGRNKTCT